MYVHVYVYVRVYVYVYMLLCVQTFMYVYARLILQMRFLHIMNVYACLDYPIGVRALETSISHQPMTDLKGTNSN